MYRSNECCAVRINSNLLIIFTIQLKKINKIKQQPILFNHYSSSDTKDKLKRLHEFILLK